MRKPKIMNPRPPVLRATTAFVTAVLLMTFGGGFAAPRPGGAVPRPAAAVGTLAGAPVQITLITGDTVSYARDGAGRVRVDVRLGPGRNAMRFQTATENGAFYLFPEDVQGQVNSGRLDRELFNLTYLAENGYGDDKSSRLPVIVQYRPDAARAGGLPGQLDARELPSVGGAAVQVDKARATEFWNAIREPASAARPPASAGSLAGVAGPDPHAALADQFSAVWLDRRVRAADDISAAQIGAPIAWAAGYDGAGTDVGVIDTGIDLGHPDLAGKVRAAQSFVPAGEPGGGDPADVSDRVGHGTHVASIVAGTGQASAGRYKGVAFGAGLIIAKALNDDGSGSESTLIEAMQWQAATQNARIVNMSLGSGPTDGTDPLSQAVNNLSERYGTLFVIAAGNSGPDAKTVGSPGTATAALTVGAVDSDDRLAYFSSRGPRLGGDIAIKPEITAPGWNIVAARAEGTSLGSGSGVPGGGPVDDNYTAASGTSMAAPHVAAAAAALLQRHPDWTGDQLKNALVGTAEDGGYTAYEQGAGRLDLGRASQALVFADTPSVSASFTAPYTDQTLRRSITYRNFGSSPVALDLTADAVRGDGAPASPGMVSVSPASVTVPALGTASAELTIEPTIGDPGLYTGRLLATGGGSERVSVPIGFRKQQPQRSLRVRLDISDLPLDFALPNFNVGFVNAVRVNDTVPQLRDEPLTVVGGERWNLDPTGRTLETTLQVALGGVYSVNTHLMWYSRDDGRIDDATLTDAEVAVDRDTTVTFDLARRVPIRIATPRPAESVAMNTMEQRTTASGITVYNGSIYSYPYVAPGNFWAMPTRQPSVGSYRFWFDQTLGAPQVAGTIVGTRRTELRMRYVSEHNDVPKFTGDRDLPLVGAADLRAGRDVRGAVVLLDPASSYDYPESHESFLADVGRAVAAGAAGVLSDSTYALAMSAPAYHDLMRVPLMWLDRDQGAHAREALRTGRPRLRIATALPAPYEYKLTYYVEGRIPPSMTFSPSDRDLARIATTYHAQYRPELEWGRAPDVSEAVHTFAPGQDFSIKASHSFPGATTRTKYYNATRPDVLWVRHYQFSYDGSIEGLRLAESFRAFAEATSEVEHWNDAILPGQGEPGPDMPPGFGVVFACDGCRQGDRLRLRALGGLGLGPFTGAADASQLYNGEPGTEESHLYLGATEIAPQTDDVGLPYYRLPARADTYRFTHVFTDAFTGPHTATTVSTTWTFGSETPASSTVAEPFVCVDAALFGDERPCARQPLIQLRYELGLAPDDTAPAGRPFEFVVRASGGAAAVDDVRVWLSADGGANWSPAMVSPRPDGAFVVRLTNPARSASPTGTVWLRTEAVDGAGNTVRQTIADAYVLR